MHSCIISTVACGLEHLEAFSGKQLRAWALTLLSPKGVTTGVTLLSPKGVTAGEDKRVARADAHSSSPWVVWLTACVAQESKALRM